MFNLSYYFAREGSAMLTDYAAAVGLVSLFASSAESMGRFWFGKSSERVIEGDFHRFKGAKPVGSSGHHSNFVVEAFDRPSRNLSFGAEPVQQ